MPVTDSARSPNLALPQRDRLRALLNEILPQNRFYARKFAGIDTSKIGSSAELARLPFTTKEELLADQADHPPYGEVLTYPPARYSRLHQTSGTSGRPLRWLDTPESWQWALDNWKIMFQMVGLRRDDRLFFPFSFGPFLGFWTAFDAAAREGYFCLPGGGMSSTARLRFLLDNGATVVFCTPTYALHLTEVAQQEGIDLRASPVRALIVAGEPGGGIPATRARIEQGWGARLFDHTGMTEAGPLGIECVENPGGIHLLETECIAEVNDPASAVAVPAGELGELVLTNLGRLGSPLIRYRTGDLVRVDPQPCPCGRGWIRLEGGILGRCDDMIHLRGNNVYPAALEAIIRRFPEVADFRIEIDETASLPNLRIDVECPNGAAARVAQQVRDAIRDELFFRAEVVAVSPGSLPRFEMKARRVSRKGAKDAKETK
jgi:phenylacetate-CoA ligase